MKPILALFVLSLLMPGISVAAKQKQLIATKTEHAPLIDGLDDQAWQVAQGLEVLLDEQPYEPSNGYSGALKTSVMLQAMYDDEYLYMKFVWQDDSLSLARFPWEKQSDGKWKQLKNLDSTLHENTYYEDKLAIYWNINEKGFEKKGCDKSCHLVDEGLLEGVKDTSSGRHFTRAGYLDEWHWKATRTNINRQMDDGYLDSEHQSNDKWGRHPDGLISGGYYNNVSKDKPAQPRWMSASILKVASSQPLYHLIDSEKIPFADKFTISARLPGIVTSPFVGGRADVDAQGHWDGDNWTLEVRRKLITQNQAEHDLQFLDLAQPYYFGITTFDNSQIAHLHHTGSLKLVFAQ